MKKRSEQSPLDELHVRMKEHIRKSRMIMIKHGLEWEIQYGARETGVDCFSVIQNEFGIRGSSRLKCYQKFCEMFSLTPRRDLVVKR